MYAFANNEWQLWWWYMCWWKGRGGGGDKVRAHPSLCTQPHTVEPWFNEVPRDWGNLLVISRVRHIEILNFTHFWQNKQNVHYIDVHVWTISVINNNYEINLYTKLWSQLRAVHSYSTRNTRIGKQNCLKLLDT